MSDTNPTGRIWPTDLLMDAERRLERLWATFHVGEDWASLDEERAAILFSINAALTKAREAASQLLSDPEPAKEVSRLVRLLGEDLAAGCSPADVIGSGSYAARIEEAVEELAGRWETAERSAGRPPMTQDQAVADIAERLSWDRTL